MSKMEIYCQEGFKIDYENIVVFVAKSVKGSEWRLSLAFRSHSITVYENLGRLASHRKPIFPT